MSIRYTCMRRALYAVALAGSFLLSMGMSYRAVAQDQQLAPQQRADVQVVKDWLNALDADDAQKALSYMTPNVEFRFGTGSQVCHGPQPVLARLNHMIMLFNPKISDLKIYAVGGPRGTAVLTSRIDTVNEGGKPGAARVKAPFAAFFVVVNGKIDEWYENPVFMGQGGGPPGAGAARRPQRAPATCASGLLPGGA